MEYPKGGFLGKTAHTVKKLQAMGIPGHAANAGYFIVLSVFPMLVLILGLLRYTDLDAGDLLRLLEGFLPDALLPAAERLIVSTYAHSGAAVVSVSAVGALWSSSRGVYALLRGLNAIYDVQEDRGYFYTRTVSVLYTFLLLVVLVLTVILNLFGEGILNLLPESADPFWQFLSGVIDLRFFLLLFLQTALFTAMFVVLPNRKNRVRDSLPGALLTALGWLIFTELFSFYVEHFSSYSNLYGSVYAMALSMLWLYFCLSILFYGGALNHLMTEKEA